MGENKSLKWMVIIIGFVAVLAVVVILWQRGIKTLPVVKIPTPVMPSPNAYDYFVKAGGAVVDRQKLDFAVDSSPRTGTPINTYDHVYSLSEKEAIIAHNAKVLSSLREGLRYQCMNPPERSINSVSYPQYAKWRTLARLLVLDGQVKEAHGDHGGAMGSSLDAVEFGAVCPRGGNLIADLVGIAIQTIGRKPAWTEVDKLNASEARAAAKRLENIIARQVPFADVLTEEKWAETASLIEVFRRFANSSGGGAFSGLMTGKPTTTDIWHRVRYATTSQRAIVHNYMHFMDEVAANARKPYASRPPAPRIPKDWYSEAVLTEMLPTFDRARFAHVHKTDTQNSLLLVTLALHAYKLEHGKYPASLNELAPSYLNQVPTDPFALSGPLRYKLKGAKYVLYSIGPDGGDNGGKPVIDLKSPRPDGRYYVSQDSKGDIVAGVNKH